MKNTKIAGQGRLSFRILSLLVALLLCIVPVSAIPVSDNSFITQPDLDPLYATDRIVVSVDTEKFEYVTPDDGITADDFPELSLTGVRHVLGNVYLLYLTNQTVQGVTAALEAVAPRVLDGQLKSAGTDGINEMHDTTFDEQFTDIAATDWCYSYLKLAWLNGWIRGVNTDTLAPNATVSRGMLPVVLSRICGVTEEIEKNPACASFSDVRTGSWYAPAIRWAYDEALVQGVRADTYMPDSSIDRQSFVTILFRFHTAYREMTPGNQASLSTFADEALAADWAQDALQWACGNGLLLGKPGGQLAPVDTLTRGEMASILVRYCHQFAPEYIRIPLTEEHTGETA